MLLTHPTRMSTHVRPHPVTPHTHRHYAHRRTPTPDVTNVYLRYPMRPTHVTIVCLQRIPTTYPCNMAYTHCRCDQRISATYVHNISPQHIPATYARNVSLQHIPTHIPNTYLHQISPHHMRLWTFVVTYGKLWLVLVNNGESW